MVALLGWALSAFAQDTGVFDEQDRDGDGWRAADDCDDDAPGVNPGGEEICFDEIDNNCNSLADEFCDDSIRLGSLGGGGGCTGGGSVAGTAMVALPLFLLRRRRGGASR